MRRMRLSQFLLFLTFWLFLFSLGTLAFATMNKSTLSLRVTGGSVTDGSTYQTREAYTFLTGGSLLLGGNHQLVINNVSGNEFQGNSISSGSNGTFSFVLVPTNLTLNAGNILAPGNSIGTEVITGDYTQNPGSTLEIEINGAGQCDLVNVLGSATINGGTLDIQPESGNYTSGTTYTFLNANNGVTGAFDSVTNHLPFFDTQLIYNPNNIQLRIDRNYASVAQTFNQRAIGNYLNTHIPVPRLSTD